MGTSVHRRFEPDFVTGIAQLRTPQEMCLDRFSHGNHCIDDNFHLRWTEARRDPVFGAPTGCAHGRSTKQRCQRAGELLE